MESLASTQCSRYIAEILHTLSSTNQHERVLHLVVDRIVRLTRCQTCAIILIDPKTEYLHIENWYGLSLTFCKEFRRRIATAAVGKLLWTGAPVLLKGNEDDPAVMNEIQLEHPFRSCVCIQIAVDHLTLGYLHIDSMNSDAFSSTDVEMLTLFADIVGIALNKSRLFEENLHLERSDKETGLEKYPKFLEHAHTALVRAQEFEERFAILILDVDNFKDITKTYGYEASHLLLSEMAILVRQALRPIDGAGRYGFDEFILLAENSDLDTAVRTARSLRERVAGQMYTHKQIRSSVSIGVAAYPQNGQTVNDLILTAKKALFEAQRSGRNNVCWFKEEWFTRETEPILC
jgi:diguanylate cyclase (GGDEF)-like protein